MAPEHSSRYWKYGEVEGDEFIFSSAGARGAGDFPSGSCRRSDLQQGIGRCGKVTNRTQQHVSLQGVWFSRLAKNVGSYACSGEPSISHGSCINVHTEWIKNESALSKSCQMKSTQQTCLFYRLVLQVSHVVKKKPAQVLLGLWQEESERRLCLHDIYWGIHGSTSLLNSRGEVLIATTLHDIHVMQGDRSH